MVRYIVFCTNPQHKIGEWYEIADSLHDTYEHIFWSVDGIKRRHIKKFGHEIPDENKPIPISRQNDTFGSHDDPKEVKKWILTELRKIMTGTF